MRRGSTWELLEVAPTDDLRAIERAYARKIDALDSERDPSLAIALREAYESARFSAQWLKPEDVPDLPVEALPAEPPPPPAAPIAPIAAPAEPQQILPPPPMVEPAPLPQVPEPNPQPAPDTAERAPQVTIVQPPRRSSPWRPRRPERVPASVTPEPSTGGIGAPSLARRLPKGLRLLPMLMAGAVVYAIFNAFSAFTPSPAPPPSEPQQQSASQIPESIAPEPAGELKSWLADIDRALEDKFGDAIDIRRIETQNPALLATLNAIWERNARSGASWQQLAREVAAETDRWYANGLTGARVSLVTEHRRLTTDMAVALRAKSAAQCVRFLQGRGRWSSELDLDEALHARERALMARVLLETDGRAREPRPATIPASVIETAAQRAGTTPEAIRAALTSADGGLVDCEIAIAIAETVLELPEAMRLPILRVL